MISIKNKLKQTKKLAFVMSHKNSILKYSLWPQLQYIWDRVCPDGGECVFEDKSLREFFRYLLRSTDLWMWRGTLKFGFALYSV